MKKDTDNPENDTKDEPQDELDGVIEEIDTICNQILDDIDEARSEKDDDE